MARSVAVTTGAGAAQRERTVGIEPLPPEGGAARYRVTLGGVVRLLDVFRHEAGVLTLRDPETCTLYTVELDPVAKTVTFGDHTLPVRAESARKKALLGVAQRDGGATGPIAVSAPMPGRVVRLLVANGGTVKASQGLLIIEAMKMENEVRAARDGTVDGLRVKEGQTVEAQELLLHIK